MNDLKYIITSVLLYDNSLNMDYIFLHNKTDGLPYYLNEKLKEIYQDPEWKLKNLREEKVQELLKINDVVPVKVNDCIELVKTRGTHMDHYNGYDIYWNETKSGINPFQWIRAEVWNKNYPSQVWTMRLDEYKENRIKEYRNILISQLI